LLTRNSIKLRELSVHNGFNQLTQSLLIKLPAHLYTAGASVQYAHNLASLAVHMEVEVKSQQVAKNGTADAAESRLQDSDKHTMVSGVAARVTLLLVLCVAIAKQQQPTH
jgi:hypothetical protein